jgi:enoyl-CoA hydratase/carnithine racemase
MVGRGRAFEILLGGEDFDGCLAERYGYVNRAVPDAEFAGFVNAFAERVSRFDLLELMARGMLGFLNKGITSLTRRLRLPAWHFDVHEPFTWPHPAQQPATRVAGQQPNCRSCDAQGCETWLTRLHKVVPRSFTGLQPGAVQSEGDRNNSDSPQPF